MPEPTPFSREAIRKRLHWTSVKRVCATPKLPTIKDDIAHLLDALESVVVKNEALAAALEQISQIQRDKCETASAEMLFMLLDNKVGIALAALALHRGETG